MSENTLLICTVGGAPEPIVASILAHRPQRIVFAASPETKSTVAERIGPALAAHESPFVLEPGRFDFAEVSNAQSFAQCVREMRDTHVRHVQPWLERGADYQVIVDFTGGTKCMTSALALAARRWNCRFSYVGGTERTKDGVGIVVSGREQIIHGANPWDALGFEAVDQAVLLFNHGDLGAAARLLDEAKQRAGESVKRGLNTLHQLCEAYDLWDRFQHRDGRTRLQNVLKAPSDLLVWFPTSAHGLIRAAESHVQWLDRLPHQSRPFVCDLLGNADRCADRGRYDDAVARLYRVCEAAAQFRLSELQLTEKPDGKILHERVPEPLRTEWAGRVKQGSVTLGLQDDYSLLAAVNDPLGRRFGELALNERDRSPLNDRNNSILAHGQSPLSKRSYANLRDVLLQLLQLQPDEVPQFPVLNY
jgi:CRISPR-associated protein (TIGR02710 family)